MASRRGSPGLDGDARFMSFMACEGVRLEPGPSGIYVRCVGRPLSWLNVTGCNWARLGRGGACGLPPFEKDCGSTLMAYAIGSTASRRGIPADRMCLFDECREQDGPAAR